MTADVEVRIKQHMQITGLSCADVQLDAEPDQTHAGIPKHQREYHYKHIAMFQFLSNVTFNYAISLQSLVNFNGIFSVKITLK